MPCAVTVAEMARLSNRVEARRRTVMAGSPKEFMVELKTQLQLDSRFVAALSC